MTIRSILALVLLLPLAGLLSSCASSSASYKEPMLSAAGFKVKKPETAQQISLYNQLEPYKVQRGEYKGKIFYAYKDEKQGVAYIGGETEYQKYQEIATARRIANDQRQAAEMNRNLAYGWYGAYRPYYGFRYY